MTDQSDILSGDITPVVTEQAAVVTPTPAPVAQPSYHDQLRSIKNEEGLQKYASVEDALTGGIHAQEFIQTLKQEKAQLQAQLEDQRNEYEASTQTAYTQPVQNTTEQGLGVEDVYSVVKEIEQNKVRESNRKTVRDTLLAHCKGDLAIAEEVLTKRLEELNMPREQLNSLIAASPDAATELLGLERKGSSSNYMSGTINPDAVEAHTPVRTPSNKPLPIGATNDHLIQQWRNSIVDVNK